jgi:single-strand DNA-binding protein
MVSETEITVRGRLGTNPELQRTAGKKPWLRLRVATNRRVRSGDAWVDGPTSWYDVKMWGDFAENVAESVRKGDAVIVQGELLIDEYTNTSNVTLRTAVIHANAFGPDLRSATARVTRVNRIDPAQAAGERPADETVPVDPSATDPTAIARRDEPPVDMSGFEEVFDGEVEAVPVE